MPQKVKFTSVEIDHIKRSRKKMTARFEFPLTRPSALAMGWGELGDFENGSNLKGDLGATVISLVPNDEALKRHAVDLETSRVHKFVATRQEIEGKKGKGTRWMVQCEAIIRQVDGCKKLEAYMMTVPKSSMVVSYEPQPEQVNLPGTELDSGCVACNNDIPLDDSGKKHVSGVKCTRPPEQQELSAVQ